MSPSLSLVPCSGLFLVAMLLMPLPALAAPDPAAPENQRVGPITRTPLNQGTLYEGCLEDKGGGQKIGLWIPDGVKEVRGILYVMHRASEARRIELQEVARSMDFAVIGMLLRWTGYEKVIPQQLARFGAEAGHPELVNAPIAGIGFSRNVGAWLRYAMLDPNRILCVLAGGGPGPGVDVRKPEQVQFFKPIPIFQVNGSSDPFVNFMEWELKVYPQIRAVELPFGAALEWDMGHTSDNNVAMYIPFLQAVMAARYPADASTAAGPVPLKPYPATNTGWLVDPGQWDGVSWGNAAPFASYAGDKLKAVWVPDEATAAVWRAFVSKDTPAVVNAAAQDAGRVTLRIDNAPATGWRHVEYFSGSQSLGQATKAPYTVDTAALAHGPHSVYAVAATDDNKRLWTQPIIVAAGRPTSQIEGKRLAAEAELPLNVIALDQAQKQSILALQSRRDGGAPSQWAMAFADDFAAGLNPAWYEYYNSARKSDSTIAAVDGAMRVKGSKQAVAMLPYEWPRDLAVEYRAMAVEDKHCDLSVVLAGNPSGSAFPWREGMMFQFGAAYNEKTQFLIFEQPVAPNPNAKITPRQWHTVRVERLAGQCTAFIDGQVVAHTQLHPDVFDRFFMVRIGLYTFGSTALFDDVKVFVRQPVDPASVQPAAPTDAEMDRLVAGLLPLLSHEFTDQRDAARRLLQDWSYELTPALRRALAAGQVQDPDTLKRLESIVAATRPAPK